MARPWRNIAVAALTLALGTAVAAWWRPHDSDSRLYAVMAEDLAARAWPQWIAPTWQGHWGRHGAFVEHPAGHLALAALLVRLGATGTQAVGALNVLGWGAGLVALAALARRYGVDARRAQALWACSPLFVQYLLRGNQEHPLTACVLAALVALSCSTTWPGAACGYAVAGAAALSIKGVAGLAVVPLGLLALACLDDHAKGSLTHKRRLVAWAVGTATLGLAVAAYLAAYRAVTGADFWRLHLEQQLGHSVGAGLRPAQKLRNLSWYAARPPWYALPAACVLLHDTYARGVRAAWRHPARRFGLGALAVYLGGFALADRKADRYLFVAYPLLALAAAVPGAAAPGGARRAVRALRFVQRHPAASLAVAVAGKLWASQLAYVFVRWWPGA